MKKLRARLLIFGLLISLFANAGLVPSATAADRQLRKIFSGWMTD